MDEIVLLGDGETTLEHGYRLLEVPLHELHVAEKRIRNRQTRRMLDLGGHPQRFGG